MILRGDDKTPKQKHAYKYVYSFKYIRAKASIYFIYAILLEMLMALEANHKIASNGFVSVGLSDVVVAYFLAYCRAHKPLHRRFIRENCVGRKIEIDPKNCFRHGIFARTPVVI